ncbi:MAG: C10 family peptidase [Candidatus Eremiobacteraeota bacterium]|nr:C10 family peptidase [Candidatus Eremiobacteraeota bacterium]
MAYSGKIRKYRVSLIFALIFLFALIGFFGCGGGGGGGGGSNPVTPSITPTPISTPALEYDTAYKWQVEAVSTDEGMSTGPVWSFTTKPEEGTMSRGEVDPDLAKTIAMAHIKRARSRSQVVKKYGQILKKMPADPVGDLKILGDKDKSNVTLAYVFNLKPKGYIVVSPDKAFPPVIAYSYTSDFSWKEVPQNALLHLLRYDMKLRLQALEKGEIPRDAMIKSGRLWSQYLSGKVLNEKHQKAIWGPLMTFPSWNQTSPYDNDCPIDPVTSERSMVGCVATSMAQVLNYWKSPTSVSFTSADNYTTPTRGIEIDATTASFSNINYAGGAPDDATKAAISFACGVSVWMNYTSDSSGANFLNVASQLGYRFGFVKTYMEDYNTGFNPTKIISNVKNGYPVIISILTADSGHSLNLDGYDDSNETYHLNFGWGGASDGWYSLPDGLPAPFTSVRACVVDIYPYTEPTPTPTPTPTPSPTTTSTPTPTPSPTSTPPIVPENPRPPDEEEDTPVDPTLHWSFCIGADHYNIYIWPSHETKPSTPTAQGLTSPQYTP